MHHGNDFSVIDLKYTFVPYFVFVFCCWTFWGHIFKL